RRPADVEVIRELVDVVRLAKQVLEHGAPRGVGHSPKRVGRIRNHMVTYYPHLGGGVKGPSEIYMAETTESTARVTVTSCSFRTVRWCPCHRRPPPQHTKPCRRPSPRSRSPGCTSITERGASS